MLVDVQDLVAVALYPDEETVIRDALRSLLRTRPRIRPELAIRRYRAEDDLSLAKAASIAGVSFDQMKEILHERGIPMGATAPVSLVGILPRITRIYTKGGLEIRIIRAIRG